MKTIRKITVTACCLAICLILGGTAIAATLNVPGDYLTIGEAIDASLNGDIINVLPGSYPGNITVDKSVSIRGVQGAEVTFVTPSANQNGFQVIASDVTISGFTISGATGFNWSGILIGGLFPGDDTHLGVTDVTVTKCILEGNAAGVYIWKANNSMIVNNTVRNNASVPGNENAGNGIIVWEGPSLNTQIVNNEVYGNDKFGIFVGADAERDFTGTKINGNNLYQNGAYRWLGYTYPPGANWLGMGFMNALGSIKVSGNKILATNGVDIWVFNAPGLRAVGNPIRNDLGPNIPMPTP
jgi:nitrous oxidase accessory protein